ncbi:MAG: bifunctional nuclease family protein [Methanoregulaceae archaeon]|nr:bifunctional nuclease family protein [Methanoregulaceae archaeon]
MTPIRCRVAGVFVAVNEQSTSPVVLLDLDGDDRCLPIYIGLWEAISIYNAVRNEVPPRPLTHDLFTEFLKTFHIVLLSLTIDTMDEGVYYGKLLLQGPDREELMDCRPSDGIALALRSDAEILLEDPVAQSSPIPRSDLPDLIDLATYLYG